MAKREIWKDVPELEGYYQISNKGGLRRVRIQADCTVKVVKYLEPKYRATQGQVLTVLCKDGLHFPVAMHRLVYKVFSPYYNPKARLSFKDGNPANCAYDNLVINGKGSWTHVNDPSVWNKISTKDLSEKRVCKLASKMGVSPRYVYSKLTKLRKAK